MSNRPIVGLMTALAAAGAIAACSSGASTTSSAPAPATSARNARPGLPASVTPSVVAMGDSIYHARGCRNCHGPDGRGTPRGPDLTDGTLLHVDGTYDDYVRIITEGVPSASIKDKSFSGMMPPRGGGRPAPLTDDQIRAVAGYVFTLRK